MKLRQREYCHNCRQHVIYEFEDITQRQVIICPNCGHQHYRELDEGTIINIRVLGRNQQEGRIYKMPDFNIARFNPDIVAPLPIVEKTYKIIGHTADGRPIIEKTDEKLGNLTTENSKIMTERRWGRDPRQI